MNKDMSLEDIVAYINEELLKGRSMKDIEMNDFGVNERVLVKRLERQRYKRSGNKFIQLDNSNPPLADMVCSIAPKTSNSPGTKIIVKEPMKLLEDENFIMMANRIEMLERAVKELMIRSSSTNEETTDFIVYSTDDKPIGKTVRLYKEIWEGLDKIKEMYPHLSSQTIINSLLNEIISKYVK